MKKRKIAVTVLFFALLLAVPILHLVMQDEDVSVYERRKLNRVPAISSESVFSGSFMTKLDSYLLDQFPLRDSFRTLKAVVKYDVFRQKDNNDIYFAGRHISKLDPVLNEKQVLYAAGKFSMIYDTCLSGSRVILSVIPDKNYFLAEENGCPHYDYDELFGIIANNISSGIEYVDITDLLDISDYYYTDAHWMQDSIVPVAERLCSVLGVPFDDDFEEKTLSPFYGVYYGQSAYPMEADCITYLRSRAIDGAVVTGLEFSDERTVYDDTQISSLDGYNVFLYGPQALLTIENPEAYTDRELIIFRDSFASSLTPLLVPSYAKITLIDLRYLSSANLGEYVDFHGQDVLFLYNTTLLNTGMLLK